MNNNMINKKKDFNILFLKKVMNLNIMLLKILNKIIKVLYKYVVVGKEIMNKCI